LPIHNAEIAEIFNQYADLLEVQGANQYRVRAYRNAARSIANLPQSASELLKQGKDLDELPGIGKDLAGKVAEIIKTGKLSPLEELKQELPGGLVQIMKLEGLGPKRAAVLYQKLGITSAAELKKAAEEQKIRELPGFAARTEEAILAELGRKGKEAEGKERLKLSVVEELASPLLDYLRKVKGVKQVEAAGSYRRGMETVGDLDILATHTEGSDIMERFVNYEDVERVIAKGKTKSTVVLRFGLQVDLRGVPEESYGSALHYFTGSKAHNVAIRQMGVKRKLKINEYGVFRGEKRIAGRTEGEVYKQVGLPYIEPELRENRGEIQAAQENKLPKLVTLEDIRGDLHAHTKATEGKASLEQMAEAAREKGYQYLAITDHSKHLSMTHGLDEKRLAEQMEEIDRLNEKLNDFLVLKGIEVDVMEDGSLDLPDDVLEKLDLVIFAVHSHFDLPADEQTERIIRAMDNPNCTILAHPTARQIGKRPGYDVDMGRLMDAALERGCSLELNAQPDRLDLDDVYCKMAKDRGLKVAISTDAHDTEELKFIRFGVYQARRGWLELEDVLNTRSWSDLKELIKR